MDLFFYQLQVTIALVFLYCGQAVAAFLVSSPSSSIIAKDRPLHSTTPDVSQGDLESFPLAPETFNGAVTYPKLLSDLRSNLLQQGFDMSRTMCATSLCGDELNRPLEIALRKMFGAGSYSLGGTAGCPFGGLTGFQKMKMHIPDGGDCVIVYGPHVGLSADGELGTVEREKCEQGGGDLRCCRSAILAADYVTKVHKGEIPLEDLPMDALDASQYFVGQMLMPHAERLSKSKNSMKELPYALFEAQTDLMNSIIERGSIADIAGKTMLLGGIQINTPPGKLDYFVPLRLDSYSSEGDSIMG